MNPRDVPAHSWNDPPKVDAEELLAEAQAQVLNLAHLLDVACDELNAYAATPMRATALVEIARDTLRRLADRMCQE